MNRTARAIAFTVGIACTLTLSLSACAAVEEGLKAVSPTTSTLPGQVPPADGGTPNANALACTTERQEVQMAVDSYTTLEGKPPASEAAMVPAYLLAESKLMDLAPDGSVVPAPNSGC